MSLLLQAAQDSWIKGVDEWLGAIDHVIVILGVPAAIIGYFKNRNKDREEAARNREAREKETEARVLATKAREVAVYEALDEKYLEFEELCLHYPSLDVFDVPDAKPVATTPLQEKRELIAFTMLFSLFERAQVMYRDQTSALRTAQWSGWDEFIAGYCKRANFQKAWERSGTTFDKKFQKYMQDKIDAAPKAAPKGAQG